MGGEQGAFTLCVDANGPVDILEITEENREQWVHKFSTEVRWSSQRPHCRYQGGKRTEKSAPLLSWYRNPQFRIRVKEKPEEEVQEKPEEKVEEKPEEEIDPDKAAFEARLAAIQAKIAAA